MRRKRPKSLLILGATGNVGRAVAEQALQQGWQIILAVRDRNKLPRELSEDNELVDIRQGDLTDQVFLDSCFANQQFAINCAGHIDQGKPFSNLVSSIVTAAQQQMTGAKRIWFMSGTALLDFKGTSFRAVDVKGVPTPYLLHKANYETVNMSDLDWSLMCAGPMICEKQDKAISYFGKGLITTIEHAPWDAPKALRFLPKMAYLLALKKAIPQMTVSYQDVARVILANMNPLGPTSRKRVGVALPKGVEAHKENYRA